MIVAAFFCLGITVLKANSLEKKYRKLYNHLVILSLSLLLFFIILHGHEIINSSKYKLYFSRFLERGAVDNKRIIIWCAFFENNTKSITDLVFGSNTLLVREDGNLHNSFLMCYAFFGLLPAMAVITLVVYSFTIGIVNKEYYMLFLFFTLLLRASTDQLFYQGYCEVFLYYFIFYFITISHRKRRDHYDISRCLFCMHNTISTY